MNEGSPTSGAPGHFRRRWKVYALAFALLGAFLWFWWREWQDSTGPTGPAAKSTPAVFPLAALSTSPFRNTGSAARYTGSEACTDCHKSRADTFRATGMGISLAMVDPVNEPPDAVFEHALSQRKFKVARKGGMLWHQEFLFADSAKETLLAEYPTKYVVGSGKHARTYLVEAEGFLVESPLTWYTMKKSWDMSPGYDRADHYGFERAVGESCLFCHAGNPRWSARVRIVCTSRNWPSAANAVMGLAPCMSSCTLPCRSRAKLPIWSWMTPSSIPCTCHASCPRPFASSVICKPT
jgi:hypothetical protein